MQYKATVNHSFWFQEIKQYINERTNGKTDKDIKEQSKTTNSFLQQSPARAIQMLNVVQKRVASLSKEEMTLFNQLDMENKKILNLISIFNTNRLFFEFMYTEFSDAVLLRKTKIMKQDIRNYIERMQQQDESIARWTDATVNRMSGLYMTFLREGELLDDQSHVVSPIIDVRLKSLLIDEEKQSYLKALGDIL